MNDLKRNISKIVKEFGIPANLKGYRCIICAIELLIKEPNRVDSVIGLYTEVANMLDTTMSRAERAIRHAIEHGWSRAERSLVKELFGHSVDIDKGKPPKNSEFLATVAEYIALMSPEVKE